MVTSVVEGGGALPTTDPPSPPKIPLLVPPPLPPLLLGQNPLQAPLLAPPPSSFGSVPDDEPPLFPRPPLVFVPHAVATVTPSVRRSPKLEAVFPREGRIVSHLDEGQRRAGPLNLKAEQIACRQVVREVFGAQSPCPRPSGKISAQKHNIQLALACAPTGQLDAHSAHTRTAWYAARMGRKLDASLAVLNGVIGDYLVKTGNELAIEMQLFAKVGGERPLAFGRSDLAGALPVATGRLVVLVHGLMSTERIWEMADRTDYGTRLTSDLGYTPLYARYNSGRQIGENGARLSETLTSLMAGYPIPVDEIVLLGHSMGGLVVRSACHVARRDGASWLSKVKRAIYLGTPHLGAPLERIGRVVAGALRMVDDPYTRLIADIANLRSEGLKDLGHADLTREDRARDRGWSIAVTDPRHPVPLLPEIEHHLVAGSIAEHPVLTALFGDSLVPVESATAGLDGAELPPGNVRHVPGVSHLALARSPAVYEYVRAWCAGEVAPVGAGAG
jgi:pimeloyl-ACP methyl ester carboxylesterase